jgi:phage shock protein C
MKRLYKNPNNALLSGVCSGIAEYIDWDPTVVRLIFFITALTLKFPIVLVYLFLAVVLPEK